MSSLKGLATIVLALTFGSASSQNINSISKKSNIEYIKNPTTINFPVLTKYDNKTQLDYIPTILKKTHSSLKNKSNLDISKYSKYNLPIDQGRLSTKGLYGYEVPTVYTNPKYFSEHKFSLSAFAEWYVDDDDSPILNAVQTQEELKEYEEIYGHKDYFYTIYNGIYLDYYPTENVALTLQADMYPYSKKIYFPDHFGFWFYFAYTF